MAEVDVLNIDDVAVHLKCSRRHVERQRSARRLPKPDYMIGNRPRWRVATIDQWVSEQDQD